jgi:hypothetical protein
MMARRFPRGLLKEPNISAASRPLVERLAEMLFGLCVAATVALVLVESAQRAAMPHQVEFGEGNVLSTAMRMARGEAAYPLPSQPPYHFSTYGPLIYWIFSLLVRAFGVSFLAPRVLSVLAMCGVAVLAVLLLRRWTGSWRVALLFGPLFLALPEVGLWASVMRADPLALLCSTLGLFTIATGTRRWPVAGLLFVAALFMKPTFIAAPAACFLYLLARRERRAAFGLAGLCAALGLATFAVLQVRTGGGFAWQLFEGHPEPYSLRRYLWIFGWVTREQLIPVLMLAAFVWHDARRRIVTLPLLFAVTATLATASAGMSGAASNHFLEWSLVVCLGAGLAYHLASQASLFWRTLRVCALYGMSASALLFSLLLWMMPNRSDDIFVAIPYMQRLFPLDDRYEPGCVELQRYLAARPGRPIISENTGAALLAGRPLLLDDPYAYTQLVVNGKWQAPVLDDLLRARAVDTVVLAHEPAKLRAYDWDRWPPGFLAALEQNYVIERYFECRNGTVVYAPAPR